MNSLFNIIFVTIFIMSSQLIRQYEVQIESKLNVECISENQSVLIEFNVVNSEDIPLYISTVGLLFEMSVFDQGGKRIIPTRKIEANALDVEDYILLKPKSSSVIKLNTQFFYQFDLKSDIIYSLESTYSNKLNNRKDKKVKTIKGEIPINTLYFKMCK